MRCFKNVVVARAVCPFWLKLAKTLESSLNTCLWLNSKNRDAPSVLATCFLKWPNRSEHPQKVSCFFFLNVRMPQAVWPFFNKNAKMATRLGASQVFKTGGCLERFASFWQTRPNRLERPYILARRHRTFYGCLERFGQCMYKLAKPPGASL